MTSKEAHKIITHVPVLSHRRVTTCECVSLHCQHQLTVGLVANSTGEPEEKQTNVDLENAYLSSQLLGLPRREDGKIKARLSTYLKIKRAGDVLELS